MNNGVLVAGEGRSVWVIGDRYTVKCSGEETGGAFALIEAIVPAGGGPPPHIHSREDEAFYVLDGELQFHVDGRSFTATNGAWVTLRKGSLHYFKNIGSKPARMLIVVTPSGLENFFLEVGREVVEGETEPVTPTPDEIQKLVQTAPKYGLEIQQVIEFTKHELENLDEEINTSLAYVPPADRKRLNAVLDKIGNLLDDLEGKHLKEKRQGVAKSAAIYQFKVTLKWSNPAIWRRIQVPDCTLGELHEVLQVVMGWEDCHLHQFIIRGEYYGPQDPEDADWDMEKKDEEEISVGEIAKTGRKGRFTYEYDFGDSWEHEIVLEKTLEPEPNVTYPRCIDGERACPPEDVGGIGGYVHFLDAISDPNHEDHDDRVEWIGGRFDPERFSVQKVNRELRQEAR